jgi:hypothetical protein
MANQLLRPAGAVYSTGTTGAPMCASRPVSPVTQSSAAASFVHVVPARTISRAYILHQGVPPSPTTGAKIQNLVPRQARGG